MKKTFLTKMAVFAVFFFSIAVLILAGTFLGINAVQDRAKWAQAADEGQSGERWIFHSGFFKDYLNWESSATPKEPDNTRDFLSMLSFNSNSNVPVGLPYQFIDINGDGLVDVLISQVDSWYVNSADHYYGIFLNNGANGMEPAYRCFYDGSAQPSGAPPTSRWYGDCADAK